MWVDNTNQFWAPINQHKTSVSRCPCKVFSFHTAAQLNCKPLLELKFYKSKTEMLFSTLLFSCCTKDASNQWPQNRGTYRILNIGHRYTPAIKIFGTNSRTLILMLRSLFFGLEITYLILNSSCFEHLCIRSGKKHQIRLDLHVEIFLYTGSDLILRP